MEFLVQSLLLRFAFVMVAEFAPAPWQLHVAGSVGSARETTCLALLNDNLWVGTMGAGLARRNAAGEVRFFDSTDGLPGNLVHDCVAVAGTIYAATEAGLARLDPESGWFETIAWGRYLRVAAVGDNLLAARDDGRVQLVRPEREPVNALPENRRLELVPVSLAATEDGQWAAGSVDGRLYLSAEDRYVKFDVPITGLQWDKGALVALTPMGGHRYDGSTFTPDPELAWAPWVDPELQAVGTSGLEHMEIRDFVHWQGDLLLATDDGVRVAPPGPEADGEPALWGRLSLDGCPCGPRLSSVTSFRGELWVGSFDNGLCRLHNGRWTHYQGVEFLPSDMVNRLAASRRQLYVATLRGLAVVDKHGTFTQYTHDQCVDNVKADCPWHPAVNGVAVDPKLHRAWVADTGAVHRIGSKGWKHYFRKRGVASSKITSLAVFDGEVAVGTSDLGIQMKFPGKNFQTVGDQRGLADNWVMDLTFDKAGALWVGTCTRGISRFYEGKWRSWTTAEGLADDYVLSINEIDGRIWVGSFRGVSVLTETGIRHLSAADGLAGNEVHDAAKHEGKVYLATDGGLAIVELRPAKRLAEVMP